ncbi:proline/glycine betaine transporter [Klebsiella pneumoniae]|nr:proline/glycine betaine transporter [Klebsiella pneumoniae]
MNRTFSTGGWRIPFFLALPLGIIGLYLRHALEETPAFQQHVDTMEQGDREGLQDGPKVSFKEIATKHWRSLLTCIRSGDFHQRDLLHAADLHAELSVA